MPRALVFLWLALCPVLGCAAGPSAYTLGGGDVVRVSVFQNPDLTTEARVSEQGSITFPLVGEISLGGLTAKQAEARVGELLERGGYIIQPQVNVHVIQFRSRQVSVLGLVNRPGRYALEDAVTRLTDVLALAGGVAAGGADTVTLVRSGGTRLAIDVASLFRASAPENVEIAAGDTLYVQRAPVFYVYGEVQRPGAFRLERNMTILQALSVAGGLTPRGTEKGLKVSRHGGDGPVESIAVGMADLVREDDVIQVRESLF